MANHNLVIKLTLDNGEFSGKISGSERDVRRFESAVGAANKKVEKAESATRSWGRALRDSIIVLGLSRHALMNLDAAFLSLPRSIITASGELERMKQLMMGLSDETTNYADIVKRAESDTDFVINLSQASPFEINTLTDSFVKFRSVGLDPTNGSMEALVDSVAKFGGSKEQLHRASVAIQQMVGKGVVSMEELRQQLGEAVPDAMKLMSRGVGVSMSELTDKISKGAVEATGALQGMFRQMAIENSGAARQMSRTWTGLTNRFQTQMTLFKKQVGDAGYFDEVKDQLKFIVEDLFDNPRTMNFAKELGEGLAALVRYARQAVETFFEWKDVIVDIGKLTFAYFAGKAVISTAFRAIAASATAASAASARMTASTITLSGVLGSLNASLTAAAANTKRLALTKVTLTGILSGLTLSVRALGAALVGLVGGPIGALALAIGALWPLYDKWKEKHSDVMSEIDVNRPELMTEKQLEDLKKSFAEYDNNIKRLDELEAKRKRVGALFQFSGRSEMNAIMEKIAEHKKLQQETGISREKLEELEKAYKRLNVNRELEKIVTDVSVRADEELQAAINKYKTSLDKLTESTKKNKKQERKALDEALKSEIEAYYDQQMDIVRKKRDELLDLGKKEDSKEYTQAIKHLDAIGEAKRKRLSVFGFESGGIQESEVKKESEQSKKLEKMLKKLELQAAKYKAKMSDANDELAKFNEQVDRGDFDKVAGSEVIEKIRSLHEYIYKTKKEIKDASKAAREFDRSLDQIQDVSRSINDTFKKRTNQNPFMKDSLRADQFRDKLKQIRDEVGKLNLSGDKLIDSVHALQSIEDILGNIDYLANASTIAAFDDAAEDIRINLLPEYEKIEQEHDKIINQLKEWHVTKKGTLSGEQEARYMNYLEALNEKKARAMETPLEKLARKWEQISARMNDIWATATEQFTASLADSIVDGENRMEDFLNSFTKMIVQMQIQAMAAGVINFFGGGSPALPAGYSGGNSAGFFGNAFADGGVMTGNGALALRKYATGGIANSPQLALFGEGSMPEAYVPLPDGRTIPVTVSGAERSASPQNINFNLINESGTQLQAEQSGSGHFDGESMILDVVLKNVSRPGDFRDSVRGALR